MGLRLVVDKDLCQECHNCTELMELMPNAFYGNGIELNWVKDDKYVMNIIRKTKRKCPVRAIELK